MVTCKKCNTPNLEWRKSAKGNWYLADPRFKSTSTGNIITIPFAHQCKSEKRVEEISNELRTSAWSAYVALNYKIFKGEPLNEYELKDFEELRQTFGEYKRGESK